jgi:hypothetical protein
MVDETARHRVLLFGGVDRVATHDDTWSWNGTNWLRLNPPTSPPARREHAMAYDVDRDRVVLFGGEDPSGQLLQDTREWDGQTWLQMAPANPPGSRREHAMAYDPFRRRVVLTGGRQNLVGSEYSDTWEWDGAQWIQRTPLTLPDPSQRHTAEWAGG